MARRAFWPLIAVVFVVYLAGAFSARPGAEVAVHDLSMLREWIQTGHFPLASPEPGHLAKPGYLLFLRAVMPEGGDEAGLRRLLVVNATLIATAMGALLLVLRRREGDAVALAAGVLLLACLPLRDAADYVLTEPLAIALVIGFLAALLWILDVRRRRGGALALGISLAALALIRPNLAWILAAMAVLVFVSGPSHRRKALALLAGLAIAILSLVLLGRVTGWPLNPFAMSPSTAVLFGSFPYSWPSSASAWPGGPTPEQTSRLQFQAAAENWRATLRARSEDRNRLILWRLAHGWLSAEQLPSRWRSEPYVALSRFARRWWWLAMIGVSAAVAATAVAGRGAWRFVPLLIAVAALAQSLLFGAETRYTLPLLPPLFTGLLLANRPLPYWGRGAAAAAAVTILMASLLVVRIPDVTTSDYAVAVPGDRIRQRISPARFAHDGEATLHLRLLAFPPGSPPGFQILVGDTVLLRSAAEDASPFPAEQAIHLSGPLLSQARADGLDIEIRVLDDSSEGRGLYYPVLPPLLGNPSRINGSERLRSAFTDGHTRGAMAIWVHGGREKSSDAASED